MSCVHSGFLTISERKNKKHARLHFACQGKGEHCLYAKTFFTMKTRQPRLWVSPKTLGHHFIVFSSKFAQIQNPCAVVHNTCTVFMSMG
ncbi:unnamed protein product [Notodromas monacha]|uniref:Uncharacterized protein n=1 Tax=Notodromas monacha TaxID=399045 RepID=A0A7R9BCD7_9CRUS|nr:unnamed protein product [Notodromas monacha]CAG0912717.1 unnamed protein product [Notodromas monacha]